MSNINQYIEYQANEAALLNVLMYLPHSARDGSTVEAIVTDLYRSISTLTTDEQRQCTLLYNAVQNNSHLANMQIGNQSKNMQEPNGSLSYATKGLNACTFTDGNGNVMVVYRGTGTGEWIDNGKGVSGLVNDTQQQIEAMSYYERIVEENNYHTKNTNIDIAGHSKGGNKAQYTVINSKYSYLIDSCYNFDGQGMSPEAIKEFIKRYGEENYLAATKKMYGFYGKNDFVNPLAQTIIPKDQMYYFETPMVDGIDDLAKNHYADAYLDISGAFNLYTERGELSKLVSRFSDELMCLPPDIRVTVANAIMGIMQGNNETVNNDAVSVADYVIGLLIATPILLVDLLGTPDGWKTIESMIGGAFVTIEEKYGVESKWIIGIIIAMTVICFLPLIIKIVGVAVLINLLEVAAELIVKFGKKLYEISLNLAQAINALIAGLKNWYNNNLNAGYMYATANPYIQVDTYKLRTYSERITNANRRVINLDLRIKNLYWRLSNNEDWFSFASKLYNLAQADRLTGYSPRLTACVAYLNSTAADFENVERNILSNAVRV